MFTLNNPAADEDPHSWADARYLVWQRERGRNGTEHYQGYVVWKTVKSLAQCKQVSSRAHWETRRGTHAQAKAYCMKSDTRVDGPWTVGEEPQPGKRTDLDRMKEAADADKPEIDIANEMFGTWAKHYRALERYRGIKQGNNRTWHTKCTVYWGAPGVGKSRRAQAEAPGAFWLAKPRAAGSGAWWDGYDRHEVVVIDEFSGWLTRDLMCRLCDRYPLNVETKGGAVALLAKRIIVTSNKPPCDWWPNVGIGAMQRRLEAPLGEIIYLEHEWVPEPLEPLVIDLAGDDESIEEPPAQRPRYDSDDEGIGLMSDEEAEIQASIAMWLGDNDDELDENSMELNQSSMWPPS